MRLVELGAPGLAVSALQDANEVDYGRGTVQGLSEVCLLLDIGLHDLHAW
jgi:hypothetical protein